jgi:inner membrane protein
MDNLTHSLAGAVLGQMGLKRKTGLAMPTLIIAANLPDIDAWTTVWGIESLAMRRGLTHGPIALLVLPLLLWAAMLAYDRWKPSQTRLPVHKTWLLALAYLGTLSHPALDWLNSYGIRFLEPFSSHWFHGDTLFIIDVWIWGALIAAVWMSIRRERNGDARWRLPAIAGFGAICLYIFANGLITGRAESETASLLAARHDPTATMKPEMVVANPVPVKFWQREILWRDDTQFGSGRYALFTGVALDPKSEPIGMDTVLIEQAKRADPAVRAFLFWSRMPVARVQGRDLMITDQRFYDPLVRGRFTVVWPIPKDK